VPTRSTTAPHGSGDLARLSQLQTVFGFFLAMSFIGSLSDRSSHLGHVSCAVPVTWHPPPLKQTRYKAKDRVLQFLETL
jgi:hypothetical protein